MRIVIGFVIMVIVAEVVGIVGLDHRAAAQGNQPSIAIYQDGVPVTTVAPSSAIEVRGVNFQRNRTYFVGVMNVCCVMQVSPANDGSFVVALTAPSAPFDGYTYYAEHFQGGNIDVDATTALAVQ